MAWKTHLVEVQVNEWCDLFPEFMTVYCTSHMFIAVNICNKQDRQKNAHSCHFSRQVVVILYNIKQFIYNYSCIYV